MFYYLYEIRNLINGKIYVGVHKTQNLNDGYMGSGKVILRAIEKHGINNFQKVILEQFTDAALMYAREKEVVTEDFLSRKDVYNLRRGGFGGFDYINKNESLRLAKNKKARASTNKVLEKKYGKEYKSVLGTIAAEACRSQMKGVYSPTYVSSFTTNPTIGEKGRKKALSITSIEKRKTTYADIGHQIGSSNSQFGTMWITDGKTNSKVKKGEDIPSGWRKGRVRIKDFGQSTCNLV